MLAAAGIAMSACSSDDDPEVEATTEESAAAGEDFLSGYVECIEEQGIELGDDWMEGFGGGEMPSFDPENAPSGMPSEMPTDMPAGGSGGIAAPEGVSSEDWQAAQEACADELPFPEGFPGGQDSGAESEDPLAAYRDCLAERGVELGDDVSALDETDADIAAAMAECAALAPADS